MMKDYTGIGGKDGWIPVSMGLPDTGVPVLVTCGIGETVIVISHMQEYECKKYWNIKASVLAWQPLPTKYKE